MRGQALVEFALVFPIMCFLILGGSEAGILVATQHDYTNEADVLAQWASYHVDDTPGKSWLSSGTPGEAWQNLLTSENSRVNCVNSNVQVIWPDNKSDAGARIKVQLTCHYIPRITRNLWEGGLDVTVNSEAVSQAKATPLPSLSPAP